MLAVNLNAATSPGADMLVISREALLQRPPRLPAWHIDVPVEDILYQTI